MASYVHIDEYPNEKYWEVNVMVFGKNRLPESEQSTHATAAFFSDEMYHPISVIITGNRELDALKELHMRLTLYNLTAVLPAVEEEIEERSVPE